MTTPHKWAKEIHAFADGAVIESAYNEVAGDWCRDSRPQWGNEGRKFRVKPLIVVNWIVVSPNGKVYGHAASSALITKASLIDHKLMRLEIDPVTFAATCVLEDV